MHNSEIKLKIFTDITKIIKGRCKLDINNKKYNNGNYYAVLSSETTYGYSQNSIFVQRKDRRRQLQNMYLSVTTQRFLSWCQNSSHMAI
jgi:hypothetical protein